MGSDNATETRIDELLEMMTVEEKVAQLGAVKASSLIVDGELDHDRAAELLEHGIGHITRLGGDAGLSPSNVARATVEIQQLLDERTRLGIPAITHEECLSGYMGPEGTTFPQSIGLASTWDPTLVREVTTTIQAQLSAIGATQALSPVCDVAKDLRWGRLEETFGEDPYLVGAMATAYVAGLQSGADGVAATLKHFVGHGRGAGGKNRSSVAVGRRELREVDCFPFEAAIRTADAASVMNAYHDIDGVPCANNEWLLTDLLRDTFEFDGTVVADYNSIANLKTEHGVARTNAGAAQQALTAGIDVELPATDCYDDLVGLIERGDVPERTLDRSVRRVLRAKVRAGLFDDPSVDTTAVRTPFDDDQPRTIAKKAATESIVLLKNDDETLPIDESDIDSVAIVGPSADDGTELLGDYAWAAHYVDAERSIDCVTPLGAIRDRAETAGISVRYEPGCSTTGTDTSGIKPAVAAAESADVTLSFVGARSAVDFSEGPTESGQTTPTSGEGCDVTTLGLPGVQEELLERIDQTDTVHIPVIVSGRAHAIGELADRVPALMYAWLPGECGGKAIDRLLFGDESPSGHLPVSLPQSVGQLPVAYNRRPNSANERYVYTESSPRFSFGHGCHYTAFDYRNVALDQTAIGPDERVTVEITVANEGKRSGQDVIQLYVHAVSPVVARPLQELVGFERVKLNPGETKRISITVDATQFAYYDASETFAVHPGEYELRVGYDADSIAQSQTVEITGFREVTTSERTYFSETTVASEREEKY
ncbi:glycoside hydrolase family 3 N-terminal domain-containing protein [Halocatena halophila]|uniref:glycoside hydrolase family 3 N-terminal domain-containing protein n=1 Tax=Halocatena halophila TaxID=2814576 RepID=UPI002ED5D3D8